MRPWHGGQAPPRIKNGSIVGQFPGLYCWVNDEINELDCTVFYYNHV